MDLKYWDGLAPTFESEVIELANEDFDGVLLEELDRVASPKKTVADLGCGPGSLLPSLTERFGRVVAVDFSAGLLDVARERFGKQRIAYLQADLTQPIEPSKRVDVCVSCSVLILPSRKRRRQILESIVRFTRPGGTVVVTVPSLESCIRVYHTLVRLRKELGSDNGLSRRAARRLFAQEVPSVLDGDVIIRGVPTHHWMQDEITVEMERAGLSVERVRRVEFGWDSEITDPPDWLGAPFPWDWLVVARRPKVRR